MARSCFEAFDRSVSTSVSFPLRELEQHQLAARLLRRRQLGEVLRLHHRGEGLEEARRELPARVDEVLAGEPLRPPQDGQLVGVDGLVGVGVGAPEQRQEALLRAAVES